MEQKIVIKKNKPINQSSALKAIKSHSNEMPPKDSRKSLPEDTLTERIPVIEEVVKVKAQQKARYQKPNFFKYNAVEKEMISMLDGTETSTNIAKSLNLSPTTFRKYKALANTLYPQQSLMTQEEKIFKEKREKGLI